MQNIHWQDGGAFTGETSAAMAAEAGASHVLIGHSERRHVFGETNEEVALKIAACCSHGLVPVVCVGETLVQRQESRVDEVILGQGYPNGEAPAIGRVAALENSGGH